MAPRNSTRSDIQTPSSFETPPLLQVNSMQEKFAHLNVPGVQWKKEYEQFTAEEERERRQIVAQLIAESDEDTDDILLYRYYVSASDIIIGRRGYIWE